MLKQIYQVLKGHLETEVTDLKHVDWYLNQFAQLGEDAVRITPAAYLRFMPLEWQHLKGPQNVQRAVMELEVHLVSDTAYGDGRDMTDATYIDHLGVEAKVYRALQSKRWMLSAAPGYEELEGTSGDRVLIETLVRTMTEPHDELDNLIVTVLVFQGNIFDYAAEPDFELAEDVVLDLGIDLVPILPEPEEEE